MSANTAFGLGWVPDLPDHRDDTFSGALAALGKGPSQTRTGDLHRYDQTHAGWNAGENSLEDYLKETGHREILKSLTADKKIAFGNGSRPLLLANPIKPLKRVDLRPFMSPIENQGRLGSCTTHAVIGLLEYLQIANRAAYVNGSRRFLYKVTRDLLQWKGDRGAYIRSTMKALRLFGVCPERYCDYNIKLYDEEADSFCYSFATNYQAVKYYRLGGLDEIKQTLTQGYPVAFGFTCYESLFSRTTALSGAITYPSMHERVVGGHAVLAVGYFEPGSHKHDAKMNYEPDDQGYLIIRNSWGTGWGWSGYGYLPFKYIPENKDRMPPLADDFWTMTQMKMPEWSDTSAAPFVLKRGQYTFSDGPPVTFNGGAPVFRFSPIISYSRSSPLDEGDDGNLDGGAPTAGSPVSGGGGGSPTF